MHAPQLPPGLLGFRAALPLGDRVFLQHIVRDVVEAAVFV